MKLITVDFDGTLFEGDSFQLMFKAVTKEFGLREWTTILAGTAQSIFLGVTKGKHALRNHFFKAVAKTFRGKTEAELASFFERLIEEGKDQINQALVEKIKEHQLEGNDVIILSGALKPFLEALTAELELSVKIIGTELVHDENGTCTGETGILINGEEKVKAVKKWLESRYSDRELIEIWAYADSESDIPLLDFVDKPIIVNPKEKMREVAEAKQWPIFGENA